MSERYLITQSLLSAWNWIYSAPEGWEESAFESFMQTLRREPTERNDAMQNGLDFEAECYRQAAGLPRDPHEKWEPGILAIAENIKGAATQVKASCDIEVSGRKFLLYGILDALKAGQIYDIKFSTKPLSSSFEYGKYLGSAQHPAYLRIVPEADRFTYLVSDGTDVCAETYSRNETQPIEGIIDDFISSMERIGFLELYREKWLAKQ